MVEIKGLCRVRFEALAGYIRRPEIVLCIEEIEWFATRDERLIGMRARDRIDKDFSWVILDRDERLRFRAIDVNSSLPSAHAAREQLCERMKEQYENPDAVYHQGDAPGTLLHGSAVVAGQGSIGEGWNPVNNRKPHGAVQTPR